MGKAVERLIDLSRRPRLARNLRKGDKIVHLGRPHKVVQVSKTESDLVVTLSAGSGLLSVTLSPDDPVTPHVVGP